MREPRRAAGLALPAACLGLAGPLNEHGHYLFDFEFALAVGREGAGRVDPRPARAVPGASRVEVGRRSLLKARDYVRFADEFLADSGLPGAAEGRGSAYLAAGDYFYDAGELAEARRALLASLRLKRTRRARGCSRERWPAR